MCDREDGTSTAQYDELGYCFLHFPNNGQIFDWRENTICQKTISANLTVKHLCEETCNYCPGDEDAEDQGADQGEEGEDQEQEAGDQAEDEQEQGGQEQEQEQEQQEQGEDDENQEEQEDNEVERK